jgi:hypothetical protein
MAVLDRRVDDLNTAKQIIWVAPTRIRVMTQHASIEKPSPVFSFTTVVSVRHVM